MSTKPSPKSKTLTVHAAPGRLVPFHRNTKAGPGGTLFMLASGENADVPNDTAVRRSMRSGDLHLGPRTSCSTCTKEK